MLFDVVMFVLAYRHRLMCQVRNLICDLLDGLNKPNKPGLRKNQFFTECRHFPHHRRDVLALGLEHADLLGFRVAQILQLLRAHLKLLALGLPLLQGRDIKVVAAGLLEAGGQDFGLIAQQDGIEHWSIAKRDRTRIIARNPI